MRLKRPTLPVLKAVTLASVAVALISGVAYAALNDQATLTGSTVSTATADLTIWDGDSFEAGAPGFTVTNLVPGTGSAEQRFYLKNGGNVDLRVTAHVPAVPTAPADGYGFNDFANVKVTFIDKHTGAATNTTMAALLTGEVSLPLSRLPAGTQGNVSVPDAEGNFAVTFDINPAAVTGSHAGLGTFNLVFTGTQPVAAS